MPQVQLDFRYLIFALILVTALGLFVFASVALDFDHAGWAQGATCGLLNLLVVLLFVHDEATA